MDTCIVIMVQKYRTARQDTFYKKSKTSFCTIRSTVLCQLTANMMKEVPVPIYPYVCVLNTYTNE
jgi:hypothetical protein